MIYVIADRHWFIQSPEEHVSELRRMASDEVDALNSSRGVLDPQLRLRTVPPIIRGTTVDGWRRVSSEWETAIVEESGA